MSSVDKWLLPEGIEELLPQQAAAIESLRRNLLDQYRSWGYLLIRPPLLEFVEALKVGTGTDLALQTFTLTDQVSGRLLGLRADLTPQVARMDAHSLKKNGCTRLCYCAPVLHSTATYLGASRELDQIGIELFGSSSVQADIEVIELMLLSVKQAGAFDKEGVVKLDLGNVRIYRTAARFAGLNQEQENQLCDILQRKAIPELTDFVEHEIKDQQAAALILKLPELCGDFGVLEKAEALFKEIKQADFSTELAVALNELKTVYHFLQQKYPELECYFDLSELRGYDYHTGLVFAIYKQGFSQALSKGGRYDSIGESFGRSRPATGFSCDLRQLLSLRSSPEIGKAILAPVAEGEHYTSLCQMVEKLRADGEVVIQFFSDEEKKLKTEVCDRELVFESQTWQIKSL